MPSQPTHSLMTGSPTPSRSGSVHSNASLARRPRIRGRTLTLPDCKRPQLAVTTAEASIASLEPPAVADFLVAEPRHPAPPPLPHRSPRRLSIPLHEQQARVGGSRAGSRDRMLSPSPTRSGRGISTVKNTASLQELIDLKNVIAGKRGSSVPRPRRVALPEKDTTSGAHGKNDSVQTRESNTSSSLYPASPHTIVHSSSTHFSHAAPELDDGGDEHDAFDVDSDSPVSEQYDGDDVSYRLRLLVSNSYFLPPAHSKPIPTDLTSSPHKAQKSLSRSNAPAFLDLFRLGKSRSRPSTSGSSSTTVVESFGPILRTTSETAAFPGYTPASQAPRAPKPGGDPTGRVVVVREIMQDLIQAAKEAEQDMKVREWRNSQIIMDAYPDMVDPTDAVDLPPPSAGYPFAVQSAVDHGLGVQQSIGAADLADRLPPPGTPHAASLLAPDDAWRKALLQEAVGYSLGNSPAESIFSGAAGARSTSSPKPDRLAIGSQSPVPPKPTRTVLNRRIISQPVFESDEDPSTDVRYDTVPGNESTCHLRLSQTPESHLRTSTYIPRRAETPTAALHTPLAPPPTRTPYSASQSDLGSPQSGSVRKVHSLPTFADSYHARRPRKQVANIQTNMPPSQSYHVMSDSVSSASSYYTDADQGQDNTRPSVTLSVFQNTPESNRPSLSERPSPAMSAFRDVHYDQHSASSHYQNSTPDRLSQVSRDSPLPRFSTMSPPPRTSTALSNAPLRPPPRTSSLHYKVVTTAATPSPTSTQFSVTSVHPHTPRAETSTFAQLSPPLAQRRGAAGPAPLLLDTNISPVPVLIHSAPAPASPSSFFDNIPYDGSQDLESEGDSTNDDDQHVGADSDSEPDSPPLPSPVRPRALSNVHQPASPRSKAAFSFARFGNQSSPNVSRMPSPLVPTFSPTMARLKIHGSPKPAPSMLSYQSVGNEPVQNQPVENTPTRPSFFSSRRGKKSPKKLDFVPPPRADSPPPLPGMDDSDPFNFPLLEPGRLVDTDSALPSPTLRSNTQDESLRKLDGLMLQHMEAEKDRIRKIARTLHQAKT